MQIETIDSTQKRGLFGGRKVYVSEITIAMSADEGKALSALVKNERIGELDLVTYPSNGGRGPNITVYLKWIVKKVQNGKPFIWSLVGETPTHRSELVETLVGAFEPLARAAFSGAGQANEGKRILVSDTVQDTEEFSAERYKHLLREEKTKLAIGAFALAALQGSHMGGEEFDTDVMVEALSNIRVFSGGFSETFFERLSVVSEMDAFVIYPAFVEHLKCVDEVDAAFDAMLAIVLADGSMSEIEKGVLFGFAGHFDLSSEEFEAMLQRIG